MIFARLSLLSDRKATGTLSKLWNNSKKKTNKNRIVWWSIGGLCFITSGYWYISQNSNQHVDAESNDTKSNGNNGARGSGGKTSIIKTDGNSNSAKSGTKNTKNVHKNAVNANVTSNRKDTTSKQVKANFNLGKNDNIKDQEEKSNHNGSDRDNRVEVKVDDSDPDNNGNMFNEVNGKNADDNLENDNTKYKDYENMTGEAECEGEGDKEGSESEGDSKQEAESYESEKKSETIDANDNLKNDNLQCEEAEEGEGEGDSEQESSNPFIKIQNQNNSSNLPLLSNDQEISHTKSEGHQSEEERETISAGDNLENDNTKYKDAETITEQAEGESEVDKEEAENQRDIPGVPGKFLETSEVNKKSATSKFYDILNTSIVGALDLHEKHYMENNNTPKPKEKPSNESINTSHDEEQSLTQPNNVTFIVDRDKIGDVYLKNPFCIKAFIDREKSTQKYQHNKKFGVQKLTSQNNRLLSQQYEQSDVNDQQNVTGQHPEYQYKNPQDEPKNITPTHEDDEANRNLGMSLCHGLI